LLHPHDQVLSEGVMLFWFPAFLRGTAGYFADGYHTTLVYERPAQTGRVKLTPLTGRDRIAVLANVGF
jgi:hypothetical protein